MLINRLNGKFPESDRARAPDIWFVHTRTMYFLVSCETAQEIAGQLRRLLPRPWIRFRDLSGSEIHMRRRDIVGVVEASAAQRAIERRLLRTLEAECRDETEDSE